MDVSALADQNHLYQRNRKAAKVWLRARAFIIWVCLFSSVPKMADYDGSPQHRSPVRI